jgi:cytoskeletal protein RodZ
MTVVQDSLGMRVGKLTPMQVQHLIEIGAFLQQVREDQGLSLEQITATTYVPLRMLRAIELGQIEVLPEAVFIQGFIRRYAEAVGLDGIAVAKQFPLSPDPKPPEPSQSSTATADAEGSMPAASVEAESSVENPRPARVTRDSSLIARRMARRSQSGSPLLWLLGSGAAVVILVGIGIAFTLNTNSSEPESETATPTPESPESEAVITPEADPTDTLPAVPVPSDPPDESAPDDGIRVTLNVRESSWVSVTVDGDVEYEGIATPGTEQEWQADQEVTVVAGNAGGVMLSYNGSDAQPMGESGEVQEVTYTTEETQTVAE